MLNNKVSDVLNNFLVQQGYSDELTAAYDPTSDSYYDIDGIVVLGGMTNKYADELYVEYCKSLGLEVSLNVETLSFLHEVGHYMTLDFLDDEEIGASEFTKLLLAMKDDGTYVKEDYIEYFSCPEEYEATWDAVKFCNACPDVVKELDSKIQEALYENC